MKNKKFELKNITKEILFNVIISKDLKIIKKIIKRIDPSYKISDEFLQIINNFVDIDKSGLASYPGLIVRTSIQDYAILYLEDSKLDEDYIVDLITEFIIDRDDYISKEFNITKFIVKKTTFLEIIKKYYE